MGKRSRSRGGISCNDAGDGISCATGGGTGAAAPKVKRTRRSVPRETPAPRSSSYRGVTRHRWTGRYEAHLWDKSCWSETQNKKGRQVYLGAYDDEEAAARAYDLAALKYWGQETALNFPVSAYQEELKDMEGQSKEEYVGSIRRKSSGFSRGVSKYRGVARHHHNGRWEARIGRVFGNKYLYLGTYATQEEAAMAYDRAAIHYRGLNAVTNFDLSNYIGLLGPNAENSDCDGAGTTKDAALPPTPENIVPGLGPRGFPRHPAGGSEEIVSPDKSPCRAAGDANTSPAMGILLESARLKEMLRRTSSGAVEPPTTPPEGEQQPPPPPPAGRFFPHDVKTFFDCPDGGGFTEEEDVIFGDLDSFVSIFLCELDG